jgi:hypothetical protein
MGVMFHQTHQVFHQTHQVFHQTHQVFHQIKFFNPNSESCVNTIGVDNDTLDETLDTLDAFDENNDGLRIFLNYLILENDH